MLTLKLVEGMDMTVPATDRWALVAGGSGGIGRSVCVALARQGWNVALTYRSNAIAGAETAQLVKEEGREALTFAIDLTDSEEVATAVRLLGNTNPLSGVVYAAGPPLPMNFLHDTSAAEFSSTIDQDLKACFNLFQPALPQLRSTRGSVAAVVTPALTRYAKADALSAIPKAGVQALIRAIANEEGRFGVRANCVGAGVIQGDGMWQALTERGVYTEAGLKKALAKTPLGRFGDVADVSHAVAFLMSDEASWITGQTLQVDGGYSV